MVKIRSLPSDVKKKGAIEAHMNKTAIKLYLCLPAKEYDCDIEIMSENRISILWHKGAGKNTFVDMSLENVQSNNMMRT